MFGHSRGSRQRRRLEIEHLESRDLFASFKPLGANFYVSLPENGISDDGTVLVGNKVNTPGRASSAAKWSQEAGWVLFGDIAEVPIPKQAYANGSRAMAISANGQTVVGYVPSVKSDMREAAFWSSALGDQRLGYLRESSEFSYAMAVSDDGRTVAGRNYTGVNGNDTEVEGFRWTASEGMVAIGDLPGRTSSVVTAMSADGRVIVGASYSGHEIPEIFRWTEQAGIVGLGVMGFEAEVSANGEVVIGTAFSTSGHWPFRWSDDLGLEDLGFPGEARFVSADGNTVVGTSGPKVVRWQSGKPTNTFEPLPGMRSLVPSALSKDGSTIVGNSNTDNGLEAFFWTAELGVQNMKSYLTDHGVSGLEAWKLVSADEVSANGRVIAGIGFNPSGQFESWSVEMPVMNPEFKVLAATAQDYDTIAFGYELSNLPPASDNQTEIRVELYRSQDASLSDDDVAVPAASVHVPYVETRGVQVVHLMNSDHTIEPCDPRDENCVDRPYLILSLKPTSLIGDDPSNNVLAFKPDTDGDALLDSWEEGEIDLDGDRVDDLHLSDGKKLSRYGANPNKKDMFVEIDYMQSQALNQQLSPAAIQIVVESFASAPVSNPDGTTGIILHVDGGSNFPMSLGSDGKWKPWGALSKANTLTWAATLGSIVNGEYSWADFNKLRVFDVDRQFTFRYAIAAHQLGYPTRPGTSGMAKPGGSEFIVSLGAWTNGVGSLYEQAGTFMHELGHTLGLTHDGHGDPLSNLLFQPNYFSVMNYTFQVSGLTKVLPLAQVETRFDYSRFTTKKLPGINESMFDENLGIVARDDAASYLTKFCTTGVCTANIQMNQPVDWDSDGLLKVVSADLNYNGTSTDDLFGENDWEVLKFAQGDIAQGAGADTAPTGHWQEAQVGEIPASDTHIAVTSTQHLRYVVPGENINLQYTLQNIGITTETLDLKVLDQSNAGGTNFSTKSVETGLPEKVTIAPGESVLLSFTYKMPNEAYPRWINLYAEKEGSPLAAFTSNLVPVDRAPLLIASETEGKTIVNEDERSDQIRLSLSTRPTGTVYIDATAEDPKQIKLDRYRFVFTPDNWNQPQTVTITGMSNTAIRGPREIAVVFQCSKDSDEMYWQAPIVRAMVTILEGSADREDVNVDGFISPIDALLVINYINSRTENHLLSIDERKLDVNQDDVVSPIDALLVINFINADSSREMELVSGVLSGAVISSYACPAAWDACFVDWQEDFRKLKRPMIS